MNPGCMLPRFSAGLLLGAVLGVSLGAQQRLYVLEPDGNYHAVVKVSQERVLVMDQGRLSAARGTRYALRKVEEYLPVFVQVVSKEAGSTSLVPLTTGPAVPLRLNHEFHFSARFESGARLEDVFLVLALESGPDERNLFAYEIGVLEASVPKEISVFVPLDRNLGSGQYRLMVFAGGAEVFTSEHTESFRDAMLGRMISKRIAGVQRMGPRPLYGPSPRYPAELRQTGQKGEVVVAMRISPQGLVLDPVVETSTHPAFGEAVLAILPQWRFVPRVEDGRPVETRVKLPLAFDPPDDTHRP